MKTVFYAKRAPLISYVGSLAIPLKAISRKKHSIKGGGLKNLSGLFTGEGMPRFKKFGCFKNCRV